MEEKKIEQLWYTWSNIGLEDRGIGFRVRAASPGLRDLRGTNYARISWYLRYKLPTSVPETIQADRAPVSLSFLKTTNGYYLTHRVYVGPDGIGRPGNYFVHLLMIPGPFSAREAISLWNSDFWQRRDVSLQEQAPDRLGSLSLQDLMRTTPRQRFDFSVVADVLRKCIIAFLSTNRLQQRILLTGSPEQIATVIWGITRSIPSALLPEMTFTTYDDEVQKCNATIVGTMTADHLYNRLNLSLKFECQPRLYEQTALDENIATFADFAVTSLQEASNGDGLAPDLEQLIEDSKYDKSVEIFIERFKNYKEQNERQQEKLEVSLSKPAEDGLTGPSKPSESTIASTHNTQLPVNPPSQTLYRTIMKFLSDNRLVLVPMIALLLATNLLTHFATAQSNVNPTAFYATATTQTQSTQAAATTATALQLAETPPEQRDSAKFLTPNQEKQFAQGGQSITFYIVVQNTGQYTWSKAGEYHLACANPKDNTNTECTSTSSSVSFSGLEDQSVPPGDKCIFIVTIQTVPGFQKPPEPPKPPDKNSHFILVNLMKGGNMQIGETQNLIYQVIA